MSRETIQWLNENVLSGFGRVPWHFDSNFQTDTSNVYPGAIPVTDVEKRLFNFQLASAAIKAICHAALSTKFSSS